MSVVLFTRISKLGRVKTRLAKDTGDRVALIAHQYLLKRTLDILAAIKNLEYQIWVDTEAKIAEKDDPLMPYQEVLKIQQGESLGERMSHAAEYNLERGLTPLIIGSDCPNMDKTYIFQANNALDSGADLVLGPALDGGYVLIGMRTLHATLFDNISWGSDQVLRQTLNEAKNLGLTVHLLETLWDVDFHADLAKLAAMEFEDFPAELGGC